MSSPEEIQREIDVTRSALSTDVDRLTDKLSPTRAVSRRADRVRASVASVRSRLMGTPGRPGSVSSGADSAKDSVRGAAASVGDAAAQMPQAVTRQTQGNPLAAGLIAFGVGWLVGSLLPATEQEQRVAGKAEQKAAELAEPIKQTVQEAAGELQRSAADAGLAIKETATQGAQETAEHARSAASQATTPLRGDPH